jgi:hypothetical protein
MQFKALLLASLAAGVFADSSTITDTSSRTSSADAMSTHSSDSRSSSDRSSSDRTSSDRSESTVAPSGYRLTTDASGSPIATYVGTDTSKPKTAALILATSTDSHSSSHTSDHSSSSTGSSSKSSTSSHNLAMATGIPLIGAAAMAGIAFAL